VHLQNGNEKYVHLSGSLPINASDLRDHSGGRSDEVWFLDAGGILQNLFCILELYKARAGWRTGTPIALASGNITVTFESGKEIDKTKDEKTTTIPRNPSC
jgi:hypothetical protein